MPPVPTTEDLAIDLAGWLATCERRLKAGWEELPALSSPCRSIAAVCRRCIAAEAEVERLRQMVQGLTDCVAAQSELLSRQAERPAG